MYLYAFCLLTMSHTVVTLPLAILEVYVMWIIAIESRFVANPSIPSLLIWTFKLPPQKQNLQEW